MSSKVWHEVTCPFPNFNGCTAEVREWASNYILHFIMDVLPWASCQIRKIAGCACAGNAGNVSPAADFKGNSQLAIPACITARASRTCRDACRDRLPAVAGKTFLAFPAHAHPQFNVSGKRPMPIVGLKLIYVKWAACHQRTWHWPNITGSLYVKIVKQAIWKYYSRPSNIIHILRLPHKP